MGKSSGDAPQPVNPYTQANAQYGLATNTANYNAALNRTNSQNPLGSNSWQITGYDSPSGTQSNGGNNPANGPQGIQPRSSIGPSLAMNPQLASLFASNPQLASTLLSQYGGSTGGGTAQQGSGAPRYTNTTSLAPQFQNPLEQPIDTSGIAGMPGGPSTTQDLQTTRDALYNQQMAYIQPEQDLQTEQVQSQLANMGATIGSPAYNNEMDRLNREQTFTNSQAQNNAITAGGAEQSRLFGLGQSALQSQITARDAPINEYNSLSSPGAASATAQTPDISGAFGQQYQGQLAGYNANVASNNADTSAAGSLIGTYLMYLALAA